MLNNGNVTMLNMAMWQCGNVTTWQCLTMLNTESNLIWAASTSSTVQTSLQKTHSFCQYCSIINQLSKLYIMLVEAKKLFVPNDCQILGVVRKQRGANDTQVEN